MAASNNALGYAAGTTNTTVRHGATLGLSGGITIDRESLTVEAGGFAGGRRPGQHFRRQHVARRGEIAHAAATPVTTIGSFSGGDAGEGLDLDGTFTAALDVTAARS